MLQCDDPINETPPERQLRFRSNSASTASKMQLESWCLQCLDIKISNSSPEFQPHGARRHKSWCLRWHALNKSELGSARYRFGIRDMFSREGLGKFGDNLSANHWKHCNLRSLALCIDWATTWSWAAVHMTPGRQQWDAAFSWYEGYYTFFCFLALQPRRCYLLCESGLIHSSQLIDASWVNVGTGQHPWCDFNLFHWHLFGLKILPLLCM